MEAKLKNIVKNPFPCILVYVLVLLVSCTSAPLHIDSGEQEASQVSNDDTTVENAERMDSEAEDSYPDEVQEYPDEVQEAEIFVVNDEVYEQTFDEVDEVIRILNGLISRQEYSEWLKYLTTEYIDSILDPEHLDELNRSSVLQRKNIAIETLEDYFIHVVGPSRSNLRLDDLLFIDDNTVQVIMFVRDRPVILYLLRRVDGEWRISV